MRIFRICPPLPILRQLHRKKDFLEKSYIEKLEVCLQENILFPASWTSEMERLGHEVAETICDDPILSASWFAENNRKHMLFADDMEELFLIEQIRDFNPDVVIIYAGAAFTVNERVRRRIKMLYPKILITVFWGDEIPGNTSYAEFFGDLQFVFTSSDIYSSLFFQVGISAHTIGNAFDPRFAVPKNIPKKFDVIFCGVTGYGYSDHIRRYNMLKELLEKDDRIIIFSNEPSYPYPRSSYGSLISMALLKVMPTSILQLFMRLRPSAESFLQKILFTKLYGIPVTSLLRQASHPNYDYFIGKKPLKRLFRSRTSEFVSSAVDYYDLLRSSKIVVNIHRDEEADIGNIRCYEVTGLGTCLLTDRGGPLSKRFDLENDIVTFNSIEECISKIDFLLKNPHERERIARNGQRKTLEKYTVRDQCKAISDILVQQYALSRSS